MSAVALQAGSMPMTNVSRRAVVLLLLGCIAVTALVFAARYALDPNNYPVVGIEVHGPTVYAERETLERIISSYSEDGFFGVDLTGLRGSIESMPWVQAASLRRLWPGVLVVSLVEHEPRAGWNGDELIGADFSAFTPPQYHLDGNAGAQWREHFAHLPQLHGPEGRHAALFQLFIAMNEALLPVGDSIVELREDARGSIRLGLHSGVLVRLGRQSTLERLMQFAKVYTHVVAPDLDNIRSIDMRYPNGFAVDYGRNETASKQGEG
ncbi:MAG: cell division protein FtsQ/DivIB [Pseudomonadota bacterium]